MRVHGRTRAGAPSTRYHRENVDACNPAKHGHGYAREKTTANRQVSCRCAVVEPWYVWAVGQEEGGGGGGGGGCGKESKEAEKKRAGKKTAPEKKREAEEKKEAVAKNKKKTLHLRVTIACLAVDNIGRCVVGWSLEGARTDRNSRDTERMQSIRQHVGPG
jgi:hypothetical protein